MKKTILGVLGAAIVALPLYASAMYCPFADYYALNIAPGGKIMPETVKVTGNLSYEAQTETFFTLGCASNRDPSSGDVSMSIGFDAKNQCEIVLHDGPYVVNPSVTAVNCVGGLYFNGIEHMGTGSHNYTLKFAS